MSWEQYSPLIGDVSCGFVGGACCGYAIKKIAKLAAFIFGLWFMSVQLLASRGLITIHYDKLIVSGDALITQISRVGVSIAPLGLSFAGGLTMGLKKG